MIRRTSMIEYLLQHNRYCNLVGIFVILAIAYFFSQHRSRINYRLVVRGLLMQFVIGFFVLKTGIGQWCIGGLSNTVKALYLFADEGSGMVFGALIDPTGPWGPLFAFRVLPVIIFFGALMSLLFYLGIIQRLVVGVNYLVRPVLGTTGPETLCAISNSFLGQTEAPLLIRHYLKTMTKSEILVVMVSGMGTISGALLAVVAGMGVPIVHLLTASMMAIPGTLVIAKMLYPETDRTTQDDAHVEMKSESANVFDAISTGTSDGLQLALNVGAMLISFLALLAMIDAILGSTIGMGLKPIFGYLFSPVGYLFGLGQADAMAVGELLGIKIVGNELIAYKEMLKMTTLSTRAINIVTYALCGFSNFSCIGIQIGGIGALVPKKRAVLAELGLYAVLGGTLSNLLSAMVAGLLL